MKGISTELKVGIFAVIVIMVLSYMTFKVGGFRFAKEKGYTLTVYFDNIAGLDEKTKVKVAGVDAGTIKKIELSDGRAKVTLFIYKGVRLHRDAVASIKATGLLGEKFLEIEPGSPNAPYLKNGDTIMNVKQMADIDTLITNLSDTASSFGSLSRSLESALGTPESKEAMQETIQNLRLITQNLNSSIVANDEKLRKVLDNINILTASIDDLVKENKEPINRTVAKIGEFSESLSVKGSELIDNLNKASKELKAILTENRPELKEGLENIKSAAASIDKIAEKIQKGEGTLGKLVTDKKLYESLNKAAEGVNKTIGSIERFRTFLDFRSEYQFKDKGGKGYFNVTLQPMPDKYYILGIVSDPVGTLKTTETTYITNGVSTTTTEQTLEKKIKFTAQFAKRFGDAALRIGLTENTFGAGVDYFMDKDRAKISLDVWDFNHDEPEATKAHVKIGADYYLFKHLFITAGYDNILNKQRRGAFIGGGIRFEDEDFKYLFGTMPRIPGK